MGRANFTDPTGAFSNYDFAINPSDDEEWSRERNITDGGPTGIGPLSPQQGERGSLIITIGGTILEQSQKDFFNFYYRLCDEHTVYYRDPIGNVFEVIVIAFKPTTIRCARNPRVPGQTWYWKYKLSMRIIRGISGELAAYGYEI